MARFSMHHCRDVAAIRHLKSCDGQSSCCGTRLLSRMFPPLLLQGGAFLPGVLSLWSSQADQRTTLSTSFGGKTVSSEQIERRLMAVLMRM